MRRQALIRSLTIIGTISSLAIALAACGGTSNGSHARAQAQPPTLTEPIGTYAIRLEAAAALKSCPQLHALDSQFFTAPLCHTQLAQIKNLKVLSSARYGNGAVIDATDAQFPKGVTFVAAVGKGGKWQLISGESIGHRTVGTTASDASGFASSVNGTVAALRSKNCAAFIKYSVTATNTPSVCVQPFASGVAKALANDPTAMPKSLGGNSVYQFYSLSLKGYPSHPAATNLTFAVGKSQPGTPGVTYPWATFAPIVG